MPFHPVYGTKARQVRAKILASFMTLAEELAGPQVQIRNHIPSQTSFTISNNNEKEPNKLVK